MDEEVSLMDFLKECNDETYQKEVRLWGLASKSGYADWVERRFHLCWSPERCKREKILHIAAKFPQEGLISMLIGAGASIEARDYKGRTPLSRACKAGKLKSIEDLIAHGADVNSQDDNGKTPLVQLMNSMVEDRDEHLSTLLRAGADAKLAYKVRLSVHIGGGSSRGLVFLAGPSSPGLGPHFCKEALGRAKVDVQPLHRAIIKDCKKSFREILKQEVDVNEVGCSDHVPLSLALLSKKNSSFFVKALLDHGADPFTKKSVLVKSAFCSEVAQACARAGPSPSRSPDHFRRHQLLHRAVAIGDSPSVNEFLLRGFEVNMRNDYGFTPLMTAVKCRNYHLIKLLLRYGADVKLLSPVGWSPRLGSRSLVVDATISGCPKTLKRILDAGLWPAVRGKQGKKLMSRSIEQHAFEVTAWLVRKKVGIRGQNENGETILHQLALLNTPNPLRAMGRRRIELNDVQDDDGNTAIHFAASLDYVQNIKILLDRGANPEIRNMNGETPLDVAKLFQNSGSEYVLGKYLEKMADGNSELSHSDSDYSLIDFEEVSGMDQ
ncbi:unnamed protein product [Caenorhabditis auriculariae]|uniref:Uncharacterized protein n=1 Tax=Caenorhabditis auriculariae TaxID=2777116 RepID=A0A8S1GNY1_9PELO|nr:unnamed protein product [Caenorhabditis auriculariae]